MGGTISFRSRRRGAGALLAAALLAGSAGRVWAGSAVPASIRGAKWLPMNVGSAQRLSRLQDLMRARPEAFNPDMLRALGRLNHDSELHLRLFASMEQYMVRTSFDAELKDAQADDHALKMVAETTAVTLRSARREVDGAEVKKEAEGWVLSIAERVLQGRIELGSLRLEAEELAGLGFFGDEIQVLTETVMAKAHGARSVSELRGFAAGLINPFYAVPPRDEDGSPVNYFRSREQADMVLHEATGHGFNDAEAELVKAIEGAKDRIVLAAPVDSQPESVRRALKKARFSGVRVEQPGLTGEVNFYRTPPAGGLGHLRQLSIDIRALGTDPVRHDKFAVIDGKVLDIPRVGRAGLDPRMNWSKQAEDAAPTWEQYPRALSRQMLEGLMFIKRPIKLDESREPQGRQAGDGAIEIRVPWDHHFHYAYDDVEPHEDGYYAGSALWARTPRGAFVIRVNARRLALHAAAIAALGYLGTLTRTGMELWQARVVAFPLLYVAVALGVNAALVAVGHRAPFASRGVRLAGGLGLLAAALAAGSLGFFLLMLSMIAG